MSTSTQANTGETVGESTGMSAMAKWMLGVTALAIMVLTVLLTLNTAGTNQVPLEWCIAFSAIASAAGVGFVAVVCTDKLVRYIAQHDAHVDQRVSSIVDGIAENRASLGEVVACIGEFGDQRANEGRIEALHNSLIQGPSPSVNINGNNGVTSLHRSTGGR